MWWKSEFFLHNILKHFLSILLIKRRKSIYHFIQQRAHSIKIHSPVMPQFLNHLRRHIPKIILSFTPNFRKKNTPSHPPPVTYSSQNQRFSDSPSNLVKHFLVLNPCRLFYCGAGKTSPNRFRGSRALNRIRIGISLVSGG